MKCPPIVQVVGYKNSRKTTLIASLVQHFNHKSYNVAVIKHDHGQFEMDREGTDTFKHRQAGATAVAISSPNRTAIIKEQGTDLEDLIDYFHEYDLILIEGYKQADYPKVVLVRKLEDIHLLSELTNVRCVMYGEEEGLVEQINRLLSLQSNIHSSIPILRVEDLRSLAEVVEQWI